MKAVPLHLGIDLGTTAVKAALFGASGNCVGSAGIEYPLETPSPDIVELDPQLYLDAARAAVAGALDRAGGGGRIVSVGVTGQAETLICVDERGVPLRKAIVWLDNRARAEAEAIEAHFGLDALCRMSGQTAMLPCWPAAKILWLRNHEPVLFHRTAKFLMAEDFLLHELTGEYATCRGLMPSSLYYDFRTGSYDDDMLSFLGISVSQLPRLLDPGEAAGIGSGRLIPALKGAVAGAAPLDHICGALGAGGGCGGVVTETTGTSLALCAGASGPVCDVRRRIGVYHGFKPGSYALLPWAPAAGLVLRYWRDRFFPSKSYAELDAAAAKISPGSDGLWMLPHWSGAVSPDVCIAARGAVFGITCAHTPEHFFRAALEGVAFLLRDNLEALREFGGECRELRALGGGARSALWLQIKADVLNCPVSVPEESECTALGGALLGAVAAGVFSSARDGQRAWCRTGFGVEPGANAAFYEKAFLKYRRTNGTLLEIHQSGVLP